MSTPIDPAGSPIHRPPWPAAAAALTAFAALYVTVGGSLVLPLLALGLLATYVVDLRMSSQSWWRWVIRIAIFGAILFLNLDKATDGGIWFYGQAAAVGQLCAAELVIQCWRRHPTGGTLSAPILLLSGFIFIAACNTFEVHYIRFFAPAYALFLSLSFLTFRPHPTVDGFRRPSLWIPLLVAVAAGSGIYYGIWHYRSELTNGFIRLFADHPGIEATGISRQPTLSASFNQEGSRARVLRIETSTPMDSHLRAMAFDTYLQGTWSPDEDQRRLEPAAPAELKSAAPGPRARVTRLEDQPQLLFAPLNCTGLDASSAEKIEWAKHPGGPVHASGSSPYTYEVILSRDTNHQGPLCVPLSREERIRCLALPALDPAVGALARRITPSSVPLQMVQAVVEYLQTHHSYSLSVSPGPGDPATDFLLHQKSAHCQYFASAAVILLRYLGVPSRYVNGYYAHETAENGVVIVRQRDAHAWTESWIDGLGWITVDATPAAGRPDEIYGPIPSWLRAWEGVQDRIADLESWFSRSSAHWQWKRAILVFVSLLALFQLFLWWYRSRRQQSQLPSVYTYSSPDADLETIAARFEEVLRIYGAPCPPNRTWKEHLCLLADSALSTSSLSHSLEAPSLGPSLAGAKPHLTAGNLQHVNLEQLDAFVNEYNRLRFGQGNTDSISRLQQRIQDLIGHQ